MTYAVARQSGNKPNKFVVRRSPLRLSLARAANKARLAEQIASANAATHRAKESRAIVYYGWHGVAIWRRDGGVHASLLKCVKFETISIKMLSAKRRTGIESHEKPISAAVFGEIFSSIKLHFAVLIVRITITVARRQIVGKRRMGEHKTGASASSIEETDARDATHSR